MTRRRVARELTKLAKELVVPRDHRVIASRAVDTIVDALADAGFTASDYLAMVYNIVRKAEREDWLVELSAQEAQSRIIGEIKGRKVRGSAVQGYLATIIMSIIMGKSSGDVMNEAVEEALRSRVGSMHVAASGFRVGDLVRFKGKRRVYRVTNVDRFGNYDLKATTGGARGSQATSVSAEELVAAEGKEEMVDKRGRSAAEAAEDLGSDVVVTIDRLQREMLGEVKRITKSGKVVVQLYYGGLNEVGEMEDYVPTKRDKGDLVTFTPSLVRGGWFWANKRESLHIVGPYKGGKLTSLLD